MSKSIVIRFQIEYIKNNQSANQRILYASIHEYKMLIYANLWSNMIQ